APAQALCKVRGVAFTPQAVWDALDDDDLLAAGFARLLLYTDPAPLPAVGDVEGAWAYYLRNWRPGAYSNGSEDGRAALLRKWRSYYATAQSARASQ
ncbi:MAG TPA: hypothetical protein VGC24_05530, partial [Burkholderiaceae bacterium]